MNPKDVRIGMDGKLLVWKGINKAADALKPSLGAIGKTAMIENGFFSPIIADEGGTIARSIKFADHHMNMGAQVILEAAENTNEDAGDGRTQTVILAQAIITGGMYRLQKDPDSLNEIIDEIDAGFAEYKKQLPNITREVRDEDMEKIATVASLDPEVGAVIAEIIKKVGRDGEVTVEPSNKLGITKEVLVGMKVNAGLLSPYMITNFDKNWAEIENVAIVVVDRRIAMNSQMVPIIQKLKNENVKDILLFADDVDGEALATVLINRKGGLNMAVVATRKFGINRGEILADICAITGATLISEGLGMKLEEFTADKAGFAESTRITKDYALIVGGKGLQSDIDQRITQIRAELEVTNSDVEKDMLKKRLASLTGGIGVIRVGGYTETEIAARRYKIQDAVNATKCAVEEGIVPGGGMAMATLSTQFMEGNTIVHAAMLEPFQQMRRNAGIAEKMPRTNFWSYFKRQASVLATVMMQGINGAYDFKKKKFVEDAFEYGLVDPVKVNRLALENAISVAKNFLTNEVFITDLDVMQLKQDNSNDN